MPEQYQPFVSIDVWTLIFTWGNLLVLYLLVKKFLYKPVKEMMDDREREVKQMYEEAEGQRRQAEQMKEEYTAKVQQAKGEAEEILRDANRRALQKEEAVLQNAREKAGELLEKADAQIESEKKKAYNEMKNELSGLAVMIASKVVERDISKEDHERLIEEFIDQMGDEKWHR